MKGLIVQKYGGTSVGTPERLASVADRIQQQHQKGTPLVVVVSAMGDTTDDLLRLAHEVSPRPFSREVDMLLTAGERISTALLSMALRDRGVSAVSLTGSQCGIVTDSNHRRARIIKILGDRVRNALAENLVVIVAGFQGVSPEKEITTLGRGGTDTTAVAMAATLGAQRCEIFTDVSGVMSADPRQVKEARHFETLPLELAAEMASCGAGVLHPRATELALKYQVSVSVLNSFEPIDQSVGTVLSLKESSTLMNVEPELKKNDRPSVDTSMENYRLIGVTADESKAFCEVDFSAVENAAVFWKRLRMELLEIDLPQQRAGSAWFWVRSEALERWKPLLEELKNEGLLAGFSVRSEIVPVTLVGECFGQENEVLVDVTELLSQSGIGIHAVWSSHRSMTLGVGSAQASQAVESLHSAFLPASVD